MTPHDRDHCESRRRSAPAGYWSARSAIRTESTSSTSSRGASSASRRRSSFCSTATRRAWTRHSTVAFEPWDRRRSSCRTSGCRTRGGTSVRCCFLTAVMISASMERGSISPSMVTIVPHLSFSGGSTCEAKGEGAVIPLLKIWPLGDPTHVMLCSAYTLQVYQLCKSVTMLPTRYFVKFTQHPHKQRLPSQCLSNEESLEPPLSFAICKS